MTRDTKRRTKNYIPVTVPFSAATPTAKLEVRESAHEIPAWANRGVWTDRMLNALTVGVRGGKWHAWNIFETYDGMIRRRLRRQLLKRHRRNPKRLSRTSRWPNAYFTDLGFRSLRDAHTRYVQSLSLGNH